MSYSMIGKAVRVQLFDRRGILMQALEGKVSDYSPNVEVAPGQSKDLVLVTGIDGYESPHLEESGEGWFEVKDVEVLDEHDFSIARN